MVIRKCLSLFHYILCLHFCVDNCRNELADETLYFRIKIIFPSASAARNKKPEGIIGLRRPTTISECVHVAKKTQNFLFLTIESIFAHRADTIASGFSINILGSSIFRISFDFVVDIVGIGVDPVFRGDRFTLDFIL